MKIILDTLFQMSATTAVVVTAVFLARLFMRTCPKKYSYILWASVGIRLTIPFSFENKLSIFNLFTEARTESVPYVSVPVAEATVQTGVDPYKLAGVIWLSGMLVLGIYGIFTYFRLQHKLRISFPMGDGIYAVEGISSPFVMGFGKPKIYIPLGLDPETEGYVLMHERTHLKRGDHLIKLFAFVLLCVHWFNPFCWLAFIFMSRDMEMSCDEKVLGIGDISSDYSMALLSFAANKRFPAPGPLCFGEVSVKRRIKNILSWKKPALWLSVISCLMCITVFVLCAGNASEKQPLEIAEGETEIIEEKAPDTYAEDTSATDSIVKDTAEPDTDTDTDTDTAEPSVPDTTLPDTVAKDTYPVHKETSPQTTPPQTEAPAADTVYIIDPPAIDYKPYYWDTEKKKPEQMDESEWSEVYEDYEGYIDIALP